MWFGKNMCTHYIRDCMCVLGVRGGGGGGGGGGAKIANCLQDLSINH